MSHINVVCSKCGVTGTSKNPYTRSVFIEEDMLTILEMTMPSFIAKQEGSDNLKKVVMSYQLAFDSDKGEDVPAVTLIQKIKEVLEEVQKLGLEEKFLCEHDFHPATEEDRENMLQTAW